MPPDSLAQPVNDALEHLRSLPWGVHGAVALCLVAGLVLWLAGRQVLKPMVVIVSALLGACAGFFVLPLTPMAGELPVYAGMLIGMAVGALLGMLLYRSAMAVGFGLVMGILAPLSAAAWLEYSRPATSLAAQVQPAAPGEDQAAQGPGAAAESLADRTKRLEGEVKNQLHDLGAGLQLSPDQIAHEGDAPKPAVQDGDNEQVTRAMQQAHDRILAFVEAARKEVGEAWSQLPARDRVIIGSAGAGGLAIGILVGMALPSWAASVVTAMFGSAMWLTSFVWLSSVLQLPWSERLSRAPLEWLVIWLAVAGTGMGIQWSGLIKWKKRGAVTA